MARILVTVKADPNISRKHGEVVCIAGVRVDVEPNEWIRLFPIPFRDLAFSKRFAKYRLIDVDVRKSRGDTRPESHTPNTDSLVVGSPVGTGKGWARRRSILEPLTIESMCELQRRQETDGTSLGLFRPVDVEEILVDKEEGDWNPSKRAIVDQPSLMFPGKTGLEKIPFRFRYSYRCADRACPGHLQSIIDWEIGEAFRRWRHEYGEGDTLRRISDRWVGDLCGPEKDTHFYAGNQHMAPKAFLVLGVFWPPRT